MKKKLFQEVFNKAKKQSGKTSKHGMSAYLERVLMDEFKFPVSKMTFVRYYEKYIDEGGSGSNNPNTDLLDKLCEYLGYENYEVFVAKNDKHLLDKHYGLRKANGSNNNNYKSNFLSYLKKHKITLIVSGVLLVGFVIVQSINTQRWMIWQEDKYIEVGFDVEKYNVGELKIYNEDRIENFSQVVPNCNTKFFSESGQVNLWYGSNKNGHLEYFTEMGKHPETGKTLREITSYMVKKHICTTY